MQICSFTVIDFKYCLYSARGSIFLWLECGKSECIATASPHLTGQLRIKHGFLLLVVMSFMACYRGTNGSVNPRIDKILLLRGELSAMVLNLKRCLNERITMYAIDPPPEFECGEHSVPAAIVRL